MKLLVALLSLIGGFITTFRYASAVSSCEVSLPQDANFACKKRRNAALAKNKEIYSLKHIPALHGFALLNMTAKELGVVALKDPFMRYYFTAYIGMTALSNEIFETYNKTTYGNEITKMSEYLPLSEFFQSTFEPVVGEYVRLPSKHEAFINDKTQWISDKCFTQQRLAGHNPMSIQRVTNHQEALRENRRCTVKTEDGRWCHFPFTYRGKVYHKCTTVRHDKPWCSTTEKYKKGKWGDCEEKDNSAEEEPRDCTVKTTKGEWCHFPFTYKGVKYEKCTTKGYFAAWCATNDENKWGVCEGKVHVQEEEEQGPVGLDWNKLKETLNPEFGWEAAVQAALKSDVALIDAINQGLIYALRYELCDDMPRSPDLTDDDPGRTMWDFLSPIALFASAQVGESNELVPVAIQMDYTPDSAVYTPSDGDNWILAKLNVQVTDLGYSQIVEHLSKVHYFMEPFCVSLKRTLPPVHPLNQILKYHCREVIVPNKFGTPALIKEEKFMDLLFAYGNVGAVRLIRDAHALSTWEVTDFRRDIEKRGVADKNLLPYFPYRDDGEKILEVIEHLVENYTNLYYKDDIDVQEDVELQAYLNEVSLNGTGPNGGIGRIQGLPASIDTKKELCDIVSRMISHLSIQHAAVNYELSDYAEYIPNLPTKLYNDTRVQEGEFSVFRLPNRQTSALEASFSNSLGTFRFDTLFDYGNELDDRKAVNLVNGYYSYLMHVVQPHMQEENRKRQEKDDLTYIYLIPRWLPNGIQT
ncbi:polyunsaturated fatty acid 5-lipoxygenase-like isoform X2 [Oculina patagonica]